MKYDVFLFFFYYCCVSASALCLVVQKTKDNEDESLKGRPQF